MSTPEPDTSDPAHPDLATARIPRATYRLQLHADMRFADAARIVPYLEALGISHLYASPYLKARAGSTHGYDIVDHNALNPEIGDEADHERLCAALAERGMFQLLDIVPNHMGVLEADNAWWLDVLECGMASVHAWTFDIEWAPPVPELRAKVLLPVLGDHYGRVLESGELKLQFDAEAGGFSVGYYDHVLPVDPQHYADILAAGGYAIKDEEVEGLLEAFRKLPLRSALDATSIETRSRDKAALKKRLAERARSHAWLRDAIDASLAALNGTAGDAASFDALDKLIDKQAWRPAYWLVAGDDVNYRRFFDVNSLAAVRMERPEVFEATHRTIFRWLAEDKVQGLRIDHPDGLCDPQQYLERLQAGYGRVTREAGREPRALYLAVEKILAEHEHMSPDWPTHGGTGYSFGNLVLGVFVDGRNEAAFDAVYEAFTGRLDPFGDQLYEAKRLIMGTSLAADLLILATALKRIAAADRRTRDFTLNRLRAALVEVAAGFPVYRTYIGEQGVSDTDRRHVEWAAAAARRSSASWEISAIDFLRDVLLGAPDEPDEKLRRAKLDFAARFQQFTSPVTAKSMEDTAFYRYHRLICLNEVGGDPRRFGTSVAAFHAANLAQARFSPFEMLGTSTHDTKRGEDVRARLAVLSEMPEEWAAAVERWHGLNAPRDPGEPSITRNDEYLLYQTLVGIWPIERPDLEGLRDLRERIQAYMQKALREAKEETSWINPNTAYEAVVTQFIDRILRQLDPSPFLTDFEAFVAPVIEDGCANSLNQLVFKLTAPGVPDIYQGCERWNFSLVDPDNRRPVDFESAEAQLAELQTLWNNAGEGRRKLHEMCLDVRDERVKLLVAWRVLQLRKQYAPLFERGSYQALAVNGPAAEHVVAYARSGGDETCVVVGTRLPWLLNQGDDSLQAAWSGTMVALPSSAATMWTEVLTGRTVAARVDDQLVIDMAELMALLPLAVLMPLG